MSEVDDAWVDACVTEYERLCPDDLSAKVAPGMVELLEELAARPDEFRLALVTGNLEPVARIKLAAAGIGHYFEPGQGGFGSDDEDRGRLPAIARGRASSPPWSRERTVVIGDTPRDIHCARVDEVRVAAVATGPYRGRGAGRGGRRRATTPARSCPSSKTGSVSGRAPGASDACPVARMS